MVIESTNVYVYGIRKIIFDLENAHRFDLHKSMYLLGYGDILRWY